MWIFLRSIIRGGLAGRGGCGPCGHKIKEHENKGTRGRVSGGNRTAVVPRLWVALRRRWGEVQMVTVALAQRGIPLCLAQICPHPFIPHLSTHYITPQNNGRWRFRMWFSLLPPSPFTNVQSLLTDFFEEHDDVSVPISEMTQFVLQGLSQSSVGSSESPQWFTVSEGFAKL